MRGPFHKLELAEKGCVNFIEMRSRADFDRFESHAGVIAGQKRVEDARGRAFAPAPPNFSPQSKNNRGGRD